MLKRKQAPSYSPTALSKCCQKHMGVQTSDEGTSYNFCSVCGQACDIYIAPKKRVKKETYKEILDRKWREERANHTHQFYKDRNPSTCLTCGIEEVELKSSDFHEAIERFKKEGGVCTTGYCQVVENVPKYPMKGVTITSTSRPCSTDCKGDSKHLHVAYTGGEQIEPEWKNTKYKPLIQKKIEDLEKSVENTLNREYANRMEISFSNAIPAREVVLKIEKRKIQRAFAILWLRYLLLITLGSLLTLAYFRFFYIIHVSAIGDLFLIRR